MREDQLDDILNAWRVEPASARLRDAVIATAPEARKSWFRKADWRGPRLWLAGAGLAAGLAGVSCGMVVSTVAVRDAQDEALVASAAGEASTATATITEPVTAL